MAMIAACVQPSVFAVTTGGDRVSHHGGRRDDPSGYPVAEVDMAHAAAQAANHPVPPAPGDRHARRDGAYLARSR